MKTQLLRISALVFGIVVSINSFGQELAPKNTTTTVPSPALEVCGSQALHQHMMETDPEYRQSQEALELATKNNSTPKAGGVIYQIPVFVHVLYHTNTAVDAQGLGAELQNVTDTQIQDAIKRVNQQFRKVAGTTWAGTSSNAADSEIELVLAVRDKNGNCTTGIDRWNVSTVATTASLTAAQKTAYENNGQGSGGMTDANVKSIGAVYTTAPTGQNRKYYEIWLVTEINGSNAGSGTKGYATFPSSHTSLTDGAVMEGRDFLSSSSGTFAHEMGHSLNLYHTFTGDDANSDGVPDTCPAGGTVGTNDDGCNDIPSHQRDASGPYQGFTDCAATTTCSGGNAALHKNNYMDYTMCTANEFSPNQVTRMSNVLTPASGTRRSLLYNAPNNNMALVPPTVSGAAAFVSDKSVICLGQSVQLFDKTSCIPNHYLDEAGDFPGITHSWTVTNATTGVSLPVSNRINPTFTPSTAGTYNVTLTITTASPAPVGSKTVTVNGAFYVAASPATACSPTTNIDYTDGNYLQAVSNVTFNTINNTTTSFANYGHQDLACTYNTNVTAGNVYTLSVSYRAGGSAAENIQVDIDWNGDGSFVGTEEVGTTSTPVRTGNTGANTTKTSTFNITIPTTATKDKLLRMRVIGEGGTISAAKRGCTSQYSFGDIEDYAIYIPTPTPLGPVPSATAQPSNATICENGNATFSTAWLNSPTSFVWEVSTDGGGSWTTVTDGGVYSNATTANLTITGAGVGLNANQYRCVASNVDGPGTSNAATLTVNANPTIPVITPGGPTTFCSGGSVTLTSSVENAYSWAPGGATTPSIVATVSGPYTVTVTNVAGCFATSAPTTVTVNPNPTISFGATNGPTTCGGTEGAMMVNGSGTGTLAQTGTATANFPGTTLPFNVTGLAAGTYNFSFTDGNGCVSNMINQSITDPAPPATPTITPNGPTTFCSGGMVDLTSSAATGNVWAPNGETSATIMVMASGSYTVTVTDPTTTCSATSAATVVTVNANPTIAVGTVTNPTACATATGSVEITGTATGDLNWTGTATGSNMGVTLPSTAMTLAAGSYNFTFTDVNGCISNTVVQALTDPGAPAAPVITPSGATTFCAGSSVDLTSDQATGNSWAPGGATTQTITVTASGSYTVTYTDMSGCSATSAPVVVTVNALPAAPTITPNGPTTFCTGGMVDLTSSQATGIVWSPNGETSATIMVMASGTYAVTYTDGNGCSATSANEVVTINPTPTIAVGATAGPTTCAGTDGTVEVTGTGTGDVSWTGTASGSATGVALPYTITGLTAGTYNVTYTEGGCASNVVSATIADPAGPAIAQGTLTGPTTCSGTDGSVEITGTGTGDVSWTGTASGSATGVTLPYTITGLAAGTYDVSYTEGGCPSNTVTSTINDPAAPTAPVVTPNGPTTFCAGGSVDLTSDLTTDIVWTPGGATTPTITVSAAGSYTVTYTDPVTMCSATSTATVVVVNALPATPIITPSGATTFCDGGSVTLSSSAATGNVWAPNGETTQTINVTVSNSYSVTVTDVNGCSATSAPEVVTVNPNPTILLGVITDPTVCGAADATVEVTGGAGTFDVNWTGSAAGTNTAVTLPNTIMGLTAGFYSISVTDANGCISNYESASINDPGAPTPPVITPDGPTTFCSGDDVILSSSPTTGTYGWVLGGETTQDITVTTSATYAVVITESGCSSTSLGTIVTVNPLPAVPTITPSGSTTFCAGGSVDLTSSAASGNVWAPNGETTATITVTAGNSYTVTVTDVNGCSATSLPEVVTVSPAPVITAGTTAGPTTCAGTDGSIEITGAGTGDLSWTGTATGPGSATSVTLPVTISTFAADSYDFTFTDASTCVSNTITVAIADPAAPAAPVVMASGSTTFCSGGSVDLTSNVSSNIIWNPNGETTATITATAAGFYSVTTTDAVTLCSSTSTPVSVVVNPTPAAPVITPSGPTSFCAGGSVDLTSSAIGGNTWTPGGATTDAITVTTSGTYSVTVTSGGCTSAPSADVVVTVLPSTVIAVGSVTQPAPCASTAGSITITGTGSGNFSWTGPTPGTAPGVTLPYTITGLSAGAYTISFVNAAGCISTPVSQTLTNVTPPATPVITPSGPTTFCAGGSVVLTSSAGSNNTWNPGGATTPSITVSTTGTYAVTVTNAAGCTATSSSVTVNVNPLPVIAIGTTSNPGCGASTGSIQITGAGSGNLSWSGTTSGSMTGITLPAVITSLPAGVFNISFVSNAGCPSNTVSQTLVDAGTSTTPVISADGPTTFCEGGSVILTAPASGSYSWAPFGETTQSITATASGNYSVTINNAGCTGTSAFTQVVVNPPLTPEMSANTPLCAGQTLVLSASTIPGANYDWTGPGFASSSPNTVSIPSVSTTQSGFYNLTVSANGCTAAVSVLVTVNALPTVTFGSVPAICKTHNPVLLTQGSPAGGTYSGTGVVGGQQFNPQAGGVPTNASVTLTYTYSDGNCSNTATSAIFVDDCAGLEEESAVILSLYPNPSNGKVTVTAEGGTVVAVTVYDNLGKLVRLIPAVNNESVDLDLYDVATGVYTFEVITNSSVERQQVMINH